MDCVINYDIPTNSKTYIHRVGRTARANRSGKAISIVSQYDIEMYQRLEKLINKRLPQFPAPKESVMILQDRVSEAQRYANMEMKELEMSKENGGGKRSKLNAKKKSKQ